MALGIAFFATSWKPAHAAVPGAAGQGVVNPAFGSYGDAIDINVPDYHEVDPKVKLTYHSGGGNGFIGVGWNLSCDSYIERSAVRNGAPKYDASDIFNLDGSILLPDTSLGGTHVTQHQSYLRIQQDVANNKWYVWDKSGTKKTYTPLYIGRNSDNPGFGDVFRWALSTVQDTYGHTATYSYWTDGSENCYLDTIAYNGYSIKFWREARPDSISFTNGIKVGHTNYRLKTIEVKVGNNTARAYKLTYNVNPGTHQSRLIAVQEYGSDVILDASGTITGGTALPAEEMTYTTAAGTGYPRPTTYDDNTDVGAWNGTPGAEDEDFQVDVNGDGKADLVRIYDVAGRSHAVVRLSNGTNFSAPTFDMDVGGWYPANIKDFLVDVNGDGRADLVRIWNNNGRANAQVNLSNGTGFPAYDSNTDVGGWTGDGGAEDENFLVDVNGDGRADVVRIWNNNGQSNVLVYLSNGLGFTYASNYNFGAWNPPFCKDYFADVNGDGRADIVRVHYTANNTASAQILLSDGTGYPAETSNHVIGGWNTAFEDFIIDVNGDGKADLVRIWGDNGRSRAQVNLSNGVNFDTLLSNNDFGAWNPPFTKDFFTDVNGDGRMDIVRIHYTANNTASAQVLLFDGNGYPPESGQTSNSIVGTWDTSFKDAFADVNGDGKADLVRIWHNNGRAIAQVDMVDGGATPPDYLIRKTNGKGGTTVIDYTPSTAWPSANVSRGGAFPTVSSIVVLDGRGNSGVTTYSYADAKYSPAVQAFLGFAYQRAVVDDLGTYVETYNRQTIQSVGQADAVYTKNIDGAIFGYTTYTYAESGDGITTPYSSLVSGTSEFEMNLASSGRENRSTFAYDNYGNQTTITYLGDTAVTGDEFVKFIAYNYNPSAYLVDLVQSETKYNGTSPIEANKLEQTLYTYDGAASFTTAPVKGGITQVDRWNNTTGGYLTAKATFDADGNEIMATDTEGATTTTTFDPIYHQFPIKSTDALGQSTSTTWDYINGVPLSSTDENGATTTMAYDVFGRAISVTNSAGQVTTTQYLNEGDPNNYKVRTTTPDGTPDGYWTDAYTDGLGRNYKTVREGPSAGVTYTREAIYNDADKSPSQTSLWYQSGGTPRWETYQYDGVGRLTKTTHADGSFATIRYTLDTAGKPCTVTTDELGHQRTVWINTLQKVTRVQEQNGSDYYNTSRTYDSEGKLIKITDNAGSVTSYTYDSLGRVVSITDPNLGTSTCTYGPSGLLTSQTDAKGNVATFTYDLLGRVKTKTVGDQTSTYYYDEAGHGASLGRQTRVVYPGGSDSYVYNNLGLVTSATKTIDGVSKTITSTYDSINRLSTLTYPDGEVVTHGYGADGALSSVSGYVTNMVYGANGELTQITYANGTTTQYTYDPNRLWLNTANVSSGNTTLYTASYVYNAAQMVTSMTQGTPVPQTTNYTYDDLNRLTSVDGAQSQSFSYDTVGNITYNSLKGLYAYGDAAHKHAVTTAGSSSYIYDANGNMTSGNGKTLAWDAMNRLSSVTQGNSVTTFAYGAGMDRLKKTSGPNTTLYFSSLLEQTNGSPLQYYYAGGLLVAKKDAAGTKTWYHADRLGSIRLMTNASGAEVRDYDYRPFGEVAATSGTMANERGFTGQITDAETGLMYYHARYYDASLGRFLSPDTAVQSPSDPQDLNAYSYCENNPVNNTDPTGHVRVFAGLSRYVTWSEVSVSQTITLRLPYVILYPALEFYWKHVSISTGIPWWNPKTISFDVPAVRTVWHTLRGTLLINKTIRLSVMVPQVHFKAIYKDVVEVVHKAREQQHRAAKAIKEQFHKGGHTLATAWHGTTKFYSAHKKLINGIAIGVGIVALIAVSGGIGAVGGVGLMEALVGTSPALATGEFAAGIAEESVVADAAESRVVPEIGRKLDYVLGRATGNAHNIARSTQMLRQLQSIGLQDTAATRELLAGHLEEVLNDSSNIVRTQTNGRVVRDSLLMGRNGIVKLESVWDNTKLITVNVFGGKL